MPKGVYLHKKGYKRPAFSKRWKKNMSKAQKGTKKPWAKYPKLRYKVSNGLTVHRGKCHNTLNKLKKGKK